MFAGPVRGSGKLRGSGATTREPLAIYERSKMVQQGAQIRRQGAQDFMAYYEFACARQESVPLPAVKMNLNKGLLDFNGDRLKLTDWLPILSSISINKHLHCIAISSTYQASLNSGDADRRFSKAGREHKCNIKKKIPAIRSKDMTFRLCKALRECLTVSPNLKTLQLNGLPLRERDLITLTRGLAKNVSLENLSLANCPIADDGLETICQSVKYSARIRMVDFTGCNLTWRGAEYMANIIKHQGMQRHGTAWAESLRYRQPQFEGMGGLRRITLNCNTLIGDRGAAALAHELTEDLWVKALDLQRCGLSNEGAHRLLESLKTNSTLCVLDIRNNALVDKVLIKTIIEKVLMNADGQSTEYCWIKPVTAETQRASSVKRLALPGVVKGKAPFRIARRKGISPKGLSSAVAQTKKSNICSRYVPWRAAARAERQRGVPPGVSVIDQSFEGAATVKVNVTSDSEGEEDDEEVVVVEVEQRPSSPVLKERITGRQFERMQMELRECRLRLGEERRARLKAESKLMEYELENARLRDANHSLSEALAATGSASVPPALSALEDDVILESIESSFTKFHAFLDLLKDAGFGQLAAMAGIDKSDFQPLGRPQFSSTAGPMLEGAASLTTEKSQEVRAQNYSLGGTVLPDPPHAVAHGTNTTSPPPVSESLCGSRIPDVTFNRAVGAAVDPGVGLEEEVEQFSKPDTQLDSGSEHSLYSQISLDKVSFGKTFQTQPRNLNSSSRQSNSHRSNSSRGYSFSNNNATSHASQSTGSHGGLSGRSSASDVSDKVESVESVGSRKRGKGRLLPAGQSGSEEKSHAGRGTLEQIRFLGLVGGQSDNESF
ncbi:hypothetical protein Q5P01_015020 [Channa striata]|uniref:Centrosomal protein 78 n=1 Tax=Channa striata TaxID=64152 RepID=A0AA88MJS7_CHASR|nr:hypothetical protein Q5P01_015020 [Channa striata]